jgi:hypothetical protein
VDWLSARPPHVQNLFGIGDWIPTVFLPPIPGVAQDFCVLGCNGQNVTIQTIGLASAWATAGVLCNGECGGIQGGDAGNRRSISARLSHKLHSGIPISGLRKSNNNVSVDAPWGDLHMLGEAGMSLYNRSITAPERISPASSTRAREPDGGRAFAHQFGHAPGRCSPSLQPERQATWWRL